jgi:cytochrome P450
MEAAMNKWRTKYGDNYTVFILGTYLTFITKQVDLKRYYNATDKMLSLVRAAKIILGALYPESQYIVEYSAIPYLQKIMTPDHLSFMARNIDTVLYDYFNTKNGRFWEENGNEVKIDLFDFMYRLTLRMNCMNFTSSRIYKNHVDEFIKLFTLLDVEKNVITPNINNFKTRLGFKSERDTAWEQWIQLMMPDIERSLKMIENDIEPTDIDIMYELVKYCKDELEKRGESFTPRLVGFTAYSCFLPAQVNTYTTTAFMILEWIHHEHDEIGRRIKEEIDHAPSIGDLTIEYLNSMEYVQACIYESIRIRTDHILGLRHCEEDVPLADNKYIPNGNLVATPLTRALDIFSNPDKFDPERHMPPREEAKADIYRVVPFGRGKHPCTGERYVKMQIKILFLRLFTMCKIELMPESMNYEETINKRQLAGMSRPTKPVYVKISKRE